jgi:hypothetical protein
MYQAELAAEKLKEETIKPSKLKELQDMIGVTQNKPSPRKTVAGWKTSNSAKLLKNSVSQ